MTDSSQRFLAIYCWFSLLFLQFYQETHPSPLPASPCDHQANSLRNSKLHCRGNVATQASSCFEPAQPQEHPTAQDRRQAVPRTLRGCHGAINALLAGVTRTTATLQRPLSQAVHRCHQRKKGGKTRMCYSTEPSTTGLKSMVLNPLKTTKRSQKAVY